MIEIYSVISGAFSTIYLIILANILSGYLFAMGLDIDNAVFRFVNDVGDVFLAPGKIIFDKLGIQTGVLDFSPIVSLFILQALESFLLSVFR